MAKRLYFGLELPSGYTFRDTLHCPLIETRPFVLTSPQIQDAFAKFSGYTHLIFTSKMAVRYFFAAADHFNLSINDLKTLTVLAVGEATAAVCESFGLGKPLVAKEETAEGVAALLDSLDLEGQKLFYPHSALARPLLGDYLKQRAASWRGCALYTTETRVPDPLPKLESFEEAVFTSPSTVDAFLQIFGPPPSHLTLTAIGPVTEEKLRTVSQKGWRTPCAINQA